jgi:hypothetical protein
MSKPTRGSTAHGVLLGVLVLSGCVNAPDRWPGPRPLPSDRDGPSRVTAENADAGTDRPPSYGDTKFTARPEESLPVDPSAADKEPDDPTVEKKYANP